MYSSCMSGMCVCVSVHHMYSKVHTVHTVCMMDGVRCELCVCGQFQILRKLSQEPVDTAMPSSVTPRQLTRLSCPASTPVRETIWVIVTSYNPPLAV